MQVILTAREAEVLATALRKFVVRDRTGELGMTHGADRFVSTNLCFSKKDRAELDQAARKLGLQSGIQVDSR